MRPSLVLLAALCLGTLGLRIAGGDEVSRPDQARFQNEFAAHWQDAGFQTSARREATLYVVEARRGDCTVLATADIFFGAKLAGFESIQPEGRQVRMYYGGWVDEFPRLRPLLAQYFHRYIDTFGISASFQPVILLAADPACDLSAVDLSGLRMHFSR